VNAGLDKQVPPNRRGTLVAPDVKGWIVQRGKADVTSTSLRKCPSESEGHACRARREGMDCPAWKGGRDKHVPPVKNLRKKGRDKHVPPKMSLGIGGARLSCPVE